MSTSSLTGISYAHNLTNAKPNGMYICKNSLTGEREVFKIKKGFVPQSLRDVILDGYKVQEDLLKNPGEARKVIDVLKLKCDAKKTKTKKQQFLVRVVMVICDCIRNWVAGFGFTSSLKLAKNLIRKLEKCASPPSTKIEKNLPPPSPSTFQPHSLKRTLSPKTKNAQEGPSGVPKATRVNGANSLFSKAPDFEASPIPRSRSMSKSKTAAPILQTPRTPSKLPKWQPPSVAQLTPDSSHKNMPKVNRQLFAEGEQLKIYKQNPANCPPRVKQKIIWEINAIKYDPLSKEQSLEGLIKDLTGKVTIDLKDSVAGHVIVDTLTHPSNNELSEGTAEWLSKQDTLDASLLCRCFEVFINKSHLGDKFSQHALLTLLQIYIDKKWQFEVRKDVIHDAVALILLDYNSNVEAWVNKMVCSMIERPEFDFHTFVKWASVFQYRFDSLSDREKKKVDDLKYEVLNRLLIRFKQSVEWHSQLNSMANPMDSSLKFALSHYKTHPTFKSKSLEQLKMQFVDFVNQKSKDIV